MKYFTSEAIYGFCWDRVVAGFWQRYPNPESKHVVTEDVLERKVLGNKLITKRLIVKHGSLPKWGEKFVTDSKSTFILEESIVDLVTKTFTTYTRNIDKQKLSSVVEKCTYMPNKDEANICQDKTVCHRQCWVKSEIYGFSGVISAFVQRRLKKNTEKTVFGFEFVLNKLYNPDFDATAVLEQKSKKGKLKESAKKAKDYAKTKAENAKAKVIHTNSCDS